MNAAAPAEGPAAAERLVVVMSDLELGAGGPADDFPHDAWFAEVLEGYGAGREEAVELVFAGDTLDFLKTSHEGAWPTRVTRDVALSKLMRIAAAHGPFFTALRRFLDSGPGARRIRFLIGNHDLELAFPEVQRALGALLGSPEQVGFPGLSWREGDLLVEHGQQADGLFRVEPGKLFQEHEGERILNLPWGAVALLDVAIPLQPLLWHHDRLKPRERVFEVLPELRELAMARYWRYWTRDYWRGWLRGADPTKRLSWGLFREVVYRFGSRDGDLRPDDSYRQRMMADDGPRVQILGHLHNPSWLAWGDRKTLVTGALRLEAMLDPDGRTQRPLPKVWAEAWLSGEGEAARVQHSRLVEVPCPPVPAELLPDPRAIRPRLLELLGSAQEREEATTAREAQEADEGEPAEAEG